MGNSMVEGNLVVPVWVDSGKVRAIVNNDGRLEISLANSDVVLDVNLASTDIDVPVEVQNLPETYLSRTQSKYGTTWINNNLQFGVGSGYHEFVHEVSAGGASDRVILSTVPDTEVWIVTNVIAQCTDPTFSYTVINLNTHLGTFPVMVGWPSFVLETIEFNGWLVLEGGEYVDGQFVGVTAGSDLHVWAHGFKMDLLV